LQAKFEDWCRENGQLDVLKGTPKNLLTGRLREEGGLVGLRTRKPHGEPRRYVGIRLRSIKELKELDD
jgi:hypothetical protein